MSKPPQRTSSRLRPTGVVGWYLAVLATLPAGAAGPLLICDPATRTPFSFPPGVNPAFTDLGTMGPNLSKAEADALAIASLAEWANVPTSHFSAAVNSNVAIDITSLNAATVIGAFNGHGGLDVIYDADGLIISDFFGAPPGVLGIASPDYASGCQILESWIVLNGSAVHPADTGGTSFAGVFTHEIGHAINLAHSQTNGAIIFLGDDVAPSSCTAPYSGSPSFAQTETMYPFIDPSPGGVGEHMATVDHLDDIASISNIYPSGGWPGAFGTLSGKIYLPNGVSEVTGVNIIARNITNPYGDAISALSGDLTQGALGPDGLYTLNGLSVSGATYAIYVDSILAGAFSTALFDIIPRQEEFWNGGSEGSNSILDDRCQSVATPPSANVNIILNSLFEVMWSTVDAGGVSFSSGSGFHLGGTTGQPDVEVFTGGPYRLTGGFWGRPVSPPVPVELQRFSIE